MEEMPANTPDLAASHNCQWPMLHRPWLRSREKGKNNSLIWLFIMCLKSILTLILERRRTLTLYSQSSQMCWVFLLLYHKCHYNWEKDSRVRLVKIIIQSLMRKKLFFIKNSGLGGKKLRSGAQTFYNSWSNPIRAKGKQSLEITANTNESGCEEI